MGLLDASSSAGGSVNTARSSSNTYGTAASQFSNLQATSANASAYQNWQAAAEFNAEEARKQREWQERMANTVYQRSIADMKKAGINPILAAQMGLGTASVGSGATASLSSPATFMGQTFADQNSASESHGSSWSNSESGLATFLESMGTWVSGMIGALNSSKQIEISLQGMGIPTSDPSKTGSSGGNKGWLGNTLKEIKQNWDQIWNKGKKYDQYQNGRYYTPYSGIFEYMHQLTGQ